MNMQHSVTQRVSRDPTCWPQGGAGTTAAPSAGLMLIDEPQRLVKDAGLTREAMRRLLSPAALVDGVDRYLASGAAVAGAACFVLLLPPLGNLDNPFYRVHPRRNDRFLAPLPPLRALYPEIDFADFDFTGHMLGALAATCGARFAELRRGIAPHWVRRMTALLDGLPQRGVLLHPPQPPWLPLPVAALARPGLSVLPVDPADPDQADAGLRAALVAAAGQGPGTPCPAATDQSFSVSSGTTAKRSPTRP